MTVPEPGQEATRARVWLLFARLRARGQARLLMATAMVNIGSTVIAALSGIVLARALGPSDRGDFAAVSAWFGLVLIVGELGQTAATTYFVARQPERAKAVTATSRVMITVSGFITAAIGLALAPVLAHGDADLTLAYRLVFLACLPVFVGASYSFALQATRLALWNWMRFSQPAAYLTLVIMLQVGGWLSLVAASAVLAGTVTVQALLAYVMARRLGLAGGKASRDLVRPLGTYGASQVLSSAPQNLNGRLDQLVLSQTVRSADLGHYAVAVTLSSLAVPVVSALGNVLFPRLAAMARRTESERRLVRSAVVSSLAVAVAVVAVVAATASVTVPWLFGSAYEPSIKLVWLLAPAGVFLASTQVMGDLLRGRGQPLAVARAQGLGLVITVVGLVVLIPVWGVTGAAVVSSAAAFVTWGFLLRDLRDPRGGRDRIGHVMDERSV